MKLCPLFESIQTPHKQRLEPPASFYDGLVAANAKLPREAIEAAIDALNPARMHYSAWGRTKEFEMYREQLRALL